MKRFLSLVKISTKSGFEALSPSKKEKSTLAKLGMVLLFIFLFAYMGMTFGVMANKMAKSAMDMGEMDRLVGMFSMIVTVVSVWLGLVALPSLLFFSQDTPVFMTMPFASWEIALAKFASAYVYLLSSIVFFGLPMAGGILIVDFSLRGLLGWLVTILLSPIWPAVLISLIYMVLLQVAPVLRNKDRMGMITGVLSLVLAVVFYILFMQASETMEMTEANMTTLPISPGVIRTMSLVFPAIKAGQLMVAGSGALTFLGGLALGLATSILAILILVIFARPFYFRILTSVAGGGSNGKTMAKGEIDKAVGQSTGAFWAIVQFEWRQLTRTSAYLLNVVISSIFVPFWMVFVIGFSAYMARDEIFESGISLEQIHHFIEEAMEFMGGPLVLGVIVGAFIGIMALYGGAPSTAVTRDAKNIESFKALPIKASRLFLAQFFTSYMVSMIPGLLLLILVMVLVGVNPAFYLSLVGSFFLVSLALSMMEFTFDVIAPKLDWEDETKAVKSSFRSTIFVLLTMGIPFALGFLVWKTGIPLDVTSLLIVGISAVILVVASLLTFGKAEAHLAKMNR